MQSNKNILNQEIFFVSQDINDLYDSSFDTTDTEESFEENIVKSDKHSNNLVTSCGLTLNFTNSSNSMEVEDSQNQKYIASKSIEPFYNQVPWHAESPKTSIELSVCGGNMYQLLVDACQPYYLVAVNVNNDNDYYRVCQKADLVAEGINIFDANEPIERLIYLLVISYFLGDTDVDNIGIVKNNGKSIAVRFDPEMCFSTYFSSNDFDKISNDLNELFDFDQKVPALSNLKIENIKNLIGGEFFLDCLQHKLIQSPQFINNILLNNKLRKNELFLAIKKIVTTPLSSYINIIESYINDDNVKKELINQLEIRIGAFRQYFNKVLFTYNPIKINTCQFINEVTKNKKRKALNDKNFEEKNIKKNSPNNDDLKSILDQAGNKRNSC